MQLQCSWQCGVLTGQQCWCWILTESLSILKHRHRAAGMSTNSPSAPGQLPQVLLTPSHLTQTPDESVDTTSRTATWRGSNVSITSPIDSPMVRRAAVNLLLGVSGDPSANDSISSWSLDDQTTTDDSSRTTPLRAHSPDPSPAGRRGSKHYRRNELWSAIKSDYLYLMDEEIIDACKVCRMVNMCN